jgi:hypothetical protein
MISPSITNNTISEILKTYKDTDASLIHDDLGHTPLRWAILKQPEILKGLITEGKRMDIAWLKPEWLDKEGDSALHIAERYASRRPTKI